MDAIALLSLVRVFRRGQYDVVHTHSSKAGILARLAARIARVPVVVHTVHGWGFNDRQRPLVVGATRRLFGTVALVVVNTRRPP